MSRYYILTEHRGVGFIDAAEVDESHPTKIRFALGAVATLFDRSELLWWSRVESPLPGPFENFAPSPRGHPAGGFSALFPQDAPWELDPVGRPRQDEHFHRRSNAALRALAAAVHSAVPPAWTKPVLELKVCYDLHARSYTLTHRLRNPETDAEAMNFSDALFASIDVYHRIALEGGENWNQSTLTFNLDAQGRCRSVEAKHAYGTDFGPR